MSVSSVSLTYTHSTLSVVSTSIESAAAALPSAKDLLNSEIVAAAFASFHAGVVYTPGSNSDAASFYTATVGRQSYEESVTYADSAPSTVIPSRSNNTASGHIIEAAQESLGTLIDVLA